MDVQGNEHQEVRLGAILDTGYQKNHTFGIT